MKELERTKEALSLAIDAMADLSCKVGAVKTLSQWVNEINAILNPAPIMEEVEEIVGWVNVYQRVDGSHYVGGTHETEDKANNTASAVGCPRISCQPIKVTVQREKKVPVERSVTVEAWVDYEGDVFGARKNDDLDGYARVAFANVDGPRNRFVTLTATWTEEPTT